ncbi:MAG: efflux RND transporter periplasmic adaptor subunit [Planctomycetota bacterium]|jgi:Cu(I)/Ag(I) efflux system membrane fusion protein
MEEREKNRREKLVAAAAGLALGIAVFLVLPSSWVFVAPEGGAHAARGGGAVKYACPMFCVVVEELPEHGRCPVCGMELTPISSESRLTRAEQRMIGLEVSRVEKLPLVRTVRAVGEVDYDETRLSRITTRTAGWLEDVRVDTTWVEVEEGDVLASLYSPDLYAAQQELLLAEGDLLPAARRRLRLLGIGDEEIAEIERTREVRRSLVLRAPRAGTVVARAALEGAAVKKGETLYTVADLSRVWVQSEVFEMDLPLVRVGQAVRLETAASAKPLAGRVAFVDPVIDRGTRTGRVRIEVANEADEDGARPLRIGQRADAWIESPLGESLAVPRSAVMRTGERTVVYSLHVEGPDRVLYEMVEVRVGPLARRAGGGAGEEYFPLMDAGSLAEGSSVATRGNLLLDSQAQLSGKPSLLFPEGSRGADADPHSGH